MLTSFYKNKKIFITGHTGFKGTWLCRILLQAGADITGYALEPPTVPSLFAQTNTAKDIRSLTGDVRDREALMKAVREAGPDIVFHLAAQPLVRLSYREPAETYETNVMGTVNVLEALRLSPAIRSFVNVTTDKVYENREWHWGYRENEPLNGYDPYSNSKSC
ncbi:MAG: GDP-mannose 4,6-dehydratase, partial [Treponema sp.]|nr:GDP-mannose 4,6-dehydratase [Treponema sp.]